MYIQNKKYLCIYNMFKTKNLGMYIYNLACNYQIK